MKRILIIDDSRSIRTIAKRALAGLDVGILEAANGEEALELLEIEGAVDLFLLDWHMDKMDGPTFLRASHDNAELATIPTIMMTVEATRKSVEEAKSLGVKGYVLKPFDAESLVERVSATLAL